MSCKKINGLEVYLYIFRIYGELKIKIWKELRKLYSILVIINRFLYEY